MDSINNSYELFNMKKSFLKLIIILCSVLMTFLGCSSMNRTHKVSHQDMQAIGQIVNTVSGQEMTPAQIQKMAQDIQKDPASKEAVEKILFGQQDRVIKYSPKTGKHYSGHLEFDPETGVKLEVLPE